MGKRNKQVISILMVAAVILMLAAGSALANTGYLTSFNNLYGTAATVLNSCSLCHTAVPSLNGYGTAYAGGHNFATIEGLDSDGDGFTNLAEITARTFPGDAASFPQAPACTDNDGDGYAVDGGSCGAVDCNDQNAAINPAAVEVCTDGIDNNCNGQIDTADPGAVNCPGPGTCTDADGDGYALEGGTCGPVDCNDTSAAIHPGTIDICGDGIDQDCSGSDLSCAAVLPPPILTVVTTGTHVDLTWTAVTGASGYKLNFAPYPYAGPQTIGTADLGNVTSVAFDLWPGAAYYVAMQAYNAEGSSVYSNIEYFIVAIPPTAPNITVTVSGLRMTVSWSQVAGATGYRLFYSPNPISDSQVVDSFDVGNVASVSYDLWGGAAYYVAVQSYNSHGSSGYSNREYFSIAGSGDLCTSCHGQPPNGGTSPNVAGAHGVHTILNGIDNVCANCHANASHNGTLERGIAATWNAKSGAAIGNSNGTCSSVICHGGITTPNWRSGTIDVATQCTACHSRGTTQYNSYNSGEHREHVERYACTQCHDPNLLGSGHFANLSTSIFEQSPAATIRSSLGYSGGRCSTPGCHGSRSWR